jgi:hypothetical protein
MKLEGGRVTLWQKNAERRKEIKSERKKKTVQP